MTDPEIVPYEDRFGQKLLPNNSTGLERALTDTNAERLMQIDVELIIDTWRPYDTFLRNLPYLAWAYDCNLWEDGWSEDTQREWVARQWEFKRIRGTLGAIEMALDFAGRDFVEGVGGYKLVEAVTPPQGFFVSPNLTVEEFNSWIRLMPQIRVYWGNDHGHSPGDEWFVDDGYIGVHAVAYDDGWELYGRKAILRQYGHSDLNLRVIQRTDIVESRVAVDWEEIRVPGKAGLGFCIDADFVGDDRYIGWDDVAADLYNVRLDRSFDAVHTELHLSTIRPTLKPISVTYERNSDVGTAGPFMFLGDGVIGEDFIDQDYGYVMLADYVYLNDPSVSALMNQGVSFIGVDRIDFPKYTMELMIDLRTKDRLPLFFVDENFVGESFIGVEDMSHIDRAIRAVRAAKSLRDRALVAFDPLRLVESSDFITEETSAGDWVSNNL